MPEDNGMSAATVRELLGAGRAIGHEIVAADRSHPVVVIPQGYKLEQMPMIPEKVRRTVGFTDVESFAAYANRFKTDGTLLFASVSDTDCKIVAHLDHHGEPSLPSATYPTEWSSHLATLICVQTKEWTTWMKNNGPEEAFTQTEFAQFLEDNERIFRSPGAAELLELVTTLEGKNNVRFNSAVRLNNGRVKLDYEEDVQLQGGIGTGAIEVPKELICAIVPFENGPTAYEVRARLRYRIGNRQIVFWYETVTPHLILRDAAKAVMDGVREKVSAPLLIGG